MKHPYRTYAAEWMNRVNSTHKELSNAKAVAEVAMLANPHDEVSEDPDFTNLAQVALESFITAARAIFQMKSQLPHVNVKTIYTAPPPDQHKSGALSHLPPSVISGLDQATVLINSQLWTESSLPDCVTFSKDKFFRENTPTHPTDIVDRTQGQSTSTSISTATMGKVSALFLTQAPL